MATLISFHAHPDDEAIATGGTLAKAAAEGHRVVLVTATKGEHGEVVEGVLGPGEALGERRVQELEDAAKVLGVERVEFLGYTDSGMMGTPENEAPGSFWSADVEDAARKLAALLTEERADVLTVYDPHGNYGHPDHIQVHRVGVRAGEIAGTAKVYEATVNRDHIRDLMARAKEMGVPDVPDVEGVDDTMGMPADAITTRVDVRPFLDAKRRAMAAHASQIAETSFFLAMPPEAFEQTWGTEWFILRGAPQGTQEDDLFQGLA
jgi:LmbE family N-acetylglucosaminyl deacetylase